MILGEERNSSLHRGLDQLSLTVPVERRAPQIGLSDRKDYQATHSKQPLWNSTEQSLACNKTKVCLGLKEISSSRNYCLEPKKKIFFPLLVLKKARTTQEGSDSSKGQKGH